MADQADDARAHPLLNRRRFLTTGSAATAGALAAATLPSSLLRAAAASAAPATLKDIEHVVILIQENRSFDHYFGTLSGIRGFDDPSAAMLQTGRSVLFQPDSANPDGYELPFRLDTATDSSECIADLSHDWGPQHLAWNRGAMDGWLAAHRAADGANGPLCMGYYTRAELPFYHQLADMFTVCDSYHCSVMAPTNPNRLMSMTATIDPDGKHGGPAVDNSGSGFSWTTYPEQLEKAGISWKVYEGPDNDTNNVLSLFNQYQDPTTSLYQKGILTQPDAAQAFALDVATGNLPQVSWILATTAQCEHPPAPPTVGENYTYQLLQSLFANPAIWAKTLFILTYDENDGFFDHVVPPTPPPGTAGEYLTVSPLPSGASGIAGPMGLGYRVPAVLISPFTRGGLVSHDTFDHTSILRFLETRFGPEVPNLSAWRRSTCGDLTSALNLAAPDTTVPALTAPPSIATAAASCANAAPAVPARQVLPHQEAGAERRAPSGAGGPAAQVADVPFVPGLAIAGGAALLAARWLARRRETGSAQR